FGHGAAPGGRGLALRAPLELESRLGLGGRGLGGLAARGARGGLPARRRSACLSGPHTARGPTRRVSADRRHAGDRHGAAAGGRQGRLLGLLLSLALLEEGPALEEGVGD